MPAGPCKSRSAATGVLARRWSFEQLDSGVKLPVGDGQVVACVGACGELLKVPERGHGSVPAERPSGRVQACPVCVGVAVSLCLHV